MPNSYFCKTAQEGRINREPYQPPCLKAELLARDHSPRLNTQNTKTLKAVNPPSRQTAMRSGGGLTHCSLTFAQKKSQRHTHRHTGARAHTHTNTHKHTQQNRKKLKSPARKKKHKNAPKMIKNAQKVFLVKMHKKCFWTKYTKICKIREKKPAQ